MRVIGLGQGRNIELFSRLALPLLERESWTGTGLFVADAASARSSEAYQRLRQDHAPPEMREWEVVPAGLRREPDTTLLRRTEQELGPPSLRAGVLADRRLSFGRAAKYRQDYAPALDERAQLGVLTETVDAAERLWQAVEPDLLVGFVPVTLGEYVLLRFAEARKVPYLLLRSTKVADYLTFHDRLFGLSRHIERRFNEDDSIPPEHYGIVRQWLSETRARGATYEGMHEAAHARRAFHPIRAARALAGNALDHARRWRDPVLRNDPQDPGRLAWAWAVQITQPLRAARTRRFARAEDRSVGADDLAAGRFRSFAFLPLHFEPEVSVQLFARPWQNQIEVARLIAHALPAGMPLVVKDHPRSAGFRSIGYYRKLLQIPNVVLADPLLPSKALAEAAEVVVVLTGNVAMEAAALRTPVVVLGESPLSALPASMVRTVHDPYVLSSEIMALLRGEHRHDEEMLERFLAAHVMASVRGELYSTLLGKGGRIAYAAGDAEAQLEALGRHLEERSADVLGVSR